MAESCIFCALKVRISAALWLKLNDINVKKVTCAGYL
jgi:hypothetical protein